MKVEIPIDEGRNSHRFSSGMKISIIRPKHCQLHCQVLCTSYICSDTSVRQGLSNSLSRQRTSILQADKVMELSVEPGLNCSRVHNVSLLPVWGWHIVNSFFFTLPGHNPPAWPWSPSLWGDTRALLWGLRAAMETSKVEALEFLAKVNYTVPTAFLPPLSGDLERGQRALEPELQPGLALLPRAVMGLLWPVPNPWPHPATRLTSSVVWNCSSLCDQKSLSTCVPDMHQ